MLSEITHLAGIVMLPKQKRQVLKQIEFVTLSQNRILVILIMNDGEIQNRVIHTAKHYSSSELQEASNFLNMNFSGKDLNNIREALLADLNRMREDVNKTMQTAIEFATSALQSGEYKGDYILAGQTNLMDFAELSDVEKLKRLFDSFNQKGISCTSWSRQ